MIYVFQVRRVVEGCYKRHPMFPALELQPSIVYILSQAHSLFKPFKPAYTHARLPTPSTTCGAEARYAYRTLIEGMPALLRTFVDDFIASVTPKVYGKRPPRVAPLQFHERLGLYNNWHVTKISWWLELGRLRFAEAFDRSNLIFTHRA